MKYSVSGITNIGTARCTNQDNFYFAGMNRELDKEILRFDGYVSRGEPFVVAVFDGMGGEEQGEKASLTASKEIYEICNIAGENFDADIILKSINTRICQEKDKEKCHMGSTCVFLEFRDDECRSWNIGDSRAYYFHENALIRMSKDHTEEALYAEIFNDNSVLGTCSSGRLLQYLGVPENEFILEPHFSAWITVRAGDTFLICSDGLTHQVDDKEISKVLSSSITLHEKKEELLNLAVRYGESDDITIVIIETLYND